MIDVNSKLLKKIEHPGGFSFQHTLKTVESDVIEVRLGVKGIERYTVTKPIAISSSHDFIIVEASFVTVDSFDVGSKGSWRLKVPATFCSSDEHFRWVEVLRPGQREIVRSVVLDGCIADLGQMFPGQYAAVVFDDAVPLTVGQFYVSPEPDASRTLELQASGSIK